MSDRTTAYAPKELPSTISRDIFITYAISGYSAGQIHCRDIDISDVSPEYVVLCVQNVTFTIPDIDAEGVRSKALDVLKREREKVLAENHQRLKAVQEKIDNLLAIEYKQTPEESRPAPTNPQTCADKGEPL